MSQPYVAEPTQQSIDQLTGAAVIEFGTNWCGYCQAAQPVIERAFTDYANVTHIKVEDGKGRPLGRSFGVKLWPTLVFLKDGQERARLVRPSDANVIVDELRKITS